MNRSTSATFQTYTWTQAHLSAVIVGVDLDVSSQSRVGKAGKDPFFDPLKRLIQKEIQDKIALGLLRGDFRDGDTIRVDEQNLELVFAKMGAGRYQPSEQPLDQTVTSD